MTAVEPLSFEGCVEDAFGIPLAAVMLTVVIDGDDRLDPVPQQEDPFELVLFAVEDRVELIFLTEMFEAGGTQVFV